MMELKFDKIGNVLKITVDGRLVAACSEEFKETVSGWLADNRFLLFDLSQMNHIDSSGLGALVYVLQKANAQDGSAKLACLHRGPGSCSTSPRSTGSSRFSIRSTRRSPRSAPKRNNRKADRWPRQSVL